MTKRFARSTHLFRLESPAWARLQFASPTPTTEHRSSPCRYEHGVRSSRHSRTIWGRPLFERFYPDWRTQQATDVGKAVDANPTWVVTVDNDVAGFVNVTFNTETMVGEIYMIAVDPPKQRRGLATLLTQHALSEMRARKMTLAIVSTGGDPGHAPARATYERSGFVAFPQVLYSTLL